jgi:prepilin-type N-terminal cleavage/methylation domain-containing protein/prepilin-type processing-associated H-X9-DG protein
MVVKHRGRGFTLIELLVVVAVIGALIAILVPSLSAARASAYRVKCSTNLRTLAMADQQYANNYGGVVSRDSGVLNGVTIPSVFRLLANDERIPLVAVGGNDPNKFESEYAVAFSKIKWLNCPSFPENGRPVSFVVNAYDPRLPDTEIGFLPLKRIYRPAEVANFTEANVNVPRDQFDVYDLWMTGHISTNISTPVAGGSGAGRMASDARHKNYINLAYYDTHVESKLIKNIKLREFTGN